MRFSCVLCMLFALGASAASYESVLKANNKGSAVQKVIEMLANMKSRGEQEVQDEKVQFAQLTAFCEGAEKEKVRSIESNKEAIGNLENEIDHLELEIDQLTANIKKADSEIANLGAKIQQLGKAMKKIEQSEEEVTEERKEEHAEFEAKDKDLGESVSALDRAVAEMKTQNVEHAQAFLSEVMHSQVSDKYKRVISSFLQSDKNLAAYKAGAPEADAYEFQSEGAITMFEDLEHKMADEKSETEREEANRQHAYRMLMQDLENRLARTKEERQEDTALKAAKTQQLADARGEKADTENALAEDEKYLSELKAMCHQKTMEFEARQELRQGELQAIGKAIEIMQSRVALIAENQKKPVKAHSFAQLRASVVSPLQKRVAAFLQARAKAVNSPLLSLLAAKTGQDVFAKVKKMINDMIRKLMEEANAEADQKAWCDAEMASNRQTREDKSDEADRLTAEIEMLSATISKIKEDITELGQGIASLDESVATATNDRNTEKEKNTAAIADAKAAETATAEAIAVLKEFYARAAEATALVQAPSMDEVYSGSMAMVKQFKEKAVQGTPQADAPTSWNVAYSGNQDQSTGVLGLLDVIQADFAGLVSDTTAAEAEAESEFTKFRNEAAQNKAVKETDVKHKQTNEVEKATALAEAKKDLKATHSELTAAMDYFDKLKPSCVDEGESYDDKVARRKEEIASLQEALKILAGDDIAAPSDDDDE